MTRAESVVRTLIGSDMELYFANPSTTEMQFVVTLDKVEGMRCILGMPGSKARPVRLEGFPDSFRSACGRRGPFLIEFRI